MIKFLLQRLAAGALVVFIVATLTFFIMHNVPGGPFDQEKSFPPEIKENILAKYHLNEPLRLQYYYYMADLLRGDLGPSFKYRNRRVQDILADTFPVSAQLGLIALIIGVGLGVSAGIVSAVKRDSIFDRLSILAASLGIALPSFVLGAFLIWLFSYKLMLLPPALWETSWNMVLPALTLGLGPAAYLARLTRSSMLEVMEKDYVRTARAKGLSGAAVILKHVLRNSMGPVVTVIGPLTAMLVTGSFIVEKIFSVPGMGRFFITAVTNRDYPLIMGVTLVYTALIVVMNLVVDVVYTVLDPRVRLE
ncbi:MAG TPA: ABC transporter permease [bacterium]|nr:ABC transporter permease [bacterium]